VAKQVQLSENDVQKMMKAMWVGTDELSTTSKFGQRSRLLLRVNYAKPYAYIGDLDRYLSLEKTNANADLDKLEDVSQCLLNVRNLFEVLGDYKDRILSIEYASSDELLCTAGENAGSFEKVFKEWADKSNVKTTNLLGEWHKG